MLAAAETFPPAPAGWSARLKDMIKTGGENVSPVEVEEVLVEHPDVARAAVVGVPDPRWGELVVAFVVPAGGRDPSPAELTAAAKVQRAELRRIAAAT